jgi:hypothetical protein
MIQLEATKKTTKYKKSEASQLFHGFEIIFCDKVFPTEVKRLIQYTMS